MPGQFIRNQRWLRNSLLGLILLPLFPGSCQRRPQTPAAPPPLNYLELGDQFYDVGDYPAAIAAYSSYLRETPGDAQIDRVLFRLGMAYALPKNPAHDPAQAIAYLNQLTNQFPASPWRPQAELLVGLEQQIQQLRLDIEQRESQIAGLTSKMEQLNSQRVGELERLQDDLTGRENRIRQLSDELEKLKAIDMQRRPTTPPR
ncbi:MAG: outer membrane protein assembly factor BamD [Acidobacteria bacterium]|nr:outer membrane protein assembly factor BamD [Acidobacteriota bacterium]